MTADQERLGVQFIAEIGALWQKRLQLQDWDVTYVMARQHEFSTPNTHGSCHKWSATKTAEIKIAYPDELDTSRPWVFEFEETIVHELLHLMFDNGEDEQPHNERAISLIACALVALAGGEE